MIMSFALLLAVAALVAREPAPLVLAWDGRVVPGLSAPLLVDNGKPGHHSYRWTTAGPWTNHGQAQATAIWT